MAKDTRTKVRFHLGAGEHYKHWKIEYPNGDYQFIDPNTTLHSLKSLVWRGNLDLKQVR